MVSIWFPYYVYFSVRLQLQMVALDPLMTVHNAILFGAQAAISR